MARRVERGDIWLYEFHKPDKRRPVVVVSRQDVIDLIDTVMVAPIRSRICGAPSEVMVGTAEGLKHESAVTLDHVQTVEKRRLRNYVGHLAPSKMTAICRALAIATSCG
ncbi:MAG TPA: type II toxin-antitoxin system PemK/MazF family toxin [Polyangia bacterium]|nr:type II toxin-antitoxin system PemK/MazF family toxin [Polyangia bacterium]